MPKPRNSYTVEFKLKVVGRAVEVGNRAASREYSVDEKSVREWRRDKSVLEKLNPRRRARRGRKAKRPRLEGEQKQWVVAVFSFYLTFCNFYVCIFI